MKVDRRSPGVNNNGKHNIQNVDTPQGLSKRESVQAARSQRNDSLQRHVVSAQANRIVDASSSTQEREREASVRPLARHNDG